MSNYIKNILNTAGWKDIEMIINKKIIECKLAKIKEDIDANEYKVIDLANRKTAKALESLLTTIKTSGDLNDKNKVNYK